MPPKTKANIGPSTPVSVASQAWTDRQVSVPDVHVLCNEMQPLVSELAQLDQLKSNMADTTTKQNFETIHRDMSREMGPMYLSLQPWCDVSQNNRRPNHAPTVFLGPYQEALDTFMGKTDKLRTEHHQWPANVHAEIFNLRESIMRHCHAMQPILHRYKRPT